MSSGSIALKKIKHSKNDGITAEGFHAPEKARRKHRPGAGTGPDARGGAPRACALRERPEPSDRRLARRDRQDHFRGLEKIQRPEKARKINGKSKKKAPTGRTDRRKRRGVEERGSKEV